MSLQFDDLAQPVLEVRADLALWDDQASVSDPRTRWRCYCQQVALTALSDWLQEESGAAIQPWPATTPTDLWHFVDGLALTLGSKRIVFLLDEAIDAAELRVPQEWVDIPGWPPDYYLAAHLDVDEQTLVLWGYTTHAQLKAIGTYDASDRTYCLSDTDMVQDFSVFWVAQAVEPGAAIKLNALPDLQPAHADILIQQLAKVPEPRLDIPFAQWAALLSHDAWRHQLYQQRQSIRPTKLSEWMTPMLTSGWQTLASLEPQTLALSLRSEASKQDAKIRSKTITLNTSVATVELKLVLQVKVEADERRHTVIQLYPTDESLLPGGLTLALELPDTVEPLQTIQAGDRDNYIQIPSFRCPPDELFRVRIQLADATFAEDFVS